MSKVFSKEYSTVKRDHKGSNLIKASQIWFSYGKVSNNYEDFKKSGL